MEYVKVDYEVNPDHNTYKSDGYDYTQPFPSLRIAYKLNQSNKISFFYNRRVDRPNEVDIRIFPKYDEPELIKVGNPTLRPQFTNSLELGYKTIFERGSFYVSTYHRIVDGTITRIATQVPGSVLLYNIFQNAEGSKSTGMELIFQQKLSNMLSYTASANIYRNTVDAFAVTNQYPVPTLYTADEQKITSGNVKLNTTWKLPHGIEGQLSTVYLAPDIIPQGKVFSRFSIDAGVKMPLDQGKGEIFINTTDILNTLRLERELKGDGFLLKSTDYYETQVIRAGYTRKF
jgi:outer membrane receptor protein involved in Fe transport